MGTTQSQPTQSQPTTYPVQSKPVKPTMDAIPYTKLGRKLEIKDEEWDNTSSLTKIDGNPLKIIQNPISNVIDLSDSNKIEVINGVKLLKASESGSIANYKILDNEARRIMQKYYKELLLTFLKFMNTETFQICGEELNFYNTQHFIVKESSQKVIGFLYEYPSWKEDSDLTVIPVTNKQLYSVADFDKIKSNLGEYIDNDVFEKMKNYVNRSFSANKHMKGDVFQKINQERSVCKNRYYVIPVSYGPMGTPPPHMSHQNLLILDKFNKQAIIIEPQFYGYINQITIDERSNYLIPTYLGLLDRLNLLDYNIVIPVTTYPQAIAEDTNCMFWTFLITVTYFLNSGEVPLDKISSTIIKKYSSKEALIEYIERFKGSLLDYLLAFEKIKTAGNRRRKTVRRSKTKRNAQKRIVHANRKLHSTK
jgi:hypothetical protein